MGRRKRILIVEDEDRVAVVLNEFLEAHYTVERVADGEAAMDIITAVRPDAILLDINLPGISGLEVLKRLREIDATIPVIMITGILDDFAITTALMRGAFAYIPKPFRGEYLLHLVSAALDRA